MRIGLSTAAYYGRLETEDAAAKVSALGLPCCEVFLETYSEYTPAFGAVVRDKLGDTQAVSIHCKTQHFESDILGQSARQRADAYALMERFLDAGQLLGAGLYVYHGPANLRGSTPDFVRWQEAIARVIDMAAARGIAFCWEVVSWCHLNSPQRVQLFQQLWPSLGFVLDIKQVLQLRQNPLDYVRAMGKALRHVHVLDMDTNGRLVLPGQGITDFSALATALRDVGYTGDIILEPYASLAENDDEILACIDWLRRVFNAE